MDQRKGKVKRTKQRKFASETRRTREDGREGKHERTYLNGT